jgi:hypothetical protein
MDINAEINTEIKRLDEILAPYEAEKENLDLQIAHYRKIRQSLVSFMSIGSTHKVGELRK